MDKNPGLRKTHAGKATGLPWGTLCHHLHRLASEGKVKVFRARQGTFLFPSYFPPKRMAAHVLLLGEQAQTLLRALDATLAVSAHELARRLDLPPKATRATLRRLVEAGLALRRGLRRPVYMATPDSLALQSTMKT